MPPSPQRRPEPEEALDATVDPAPPRLRPREAQGGDVPASGEVGRLHERVARAFSSPRRTPREAALVKALILAATCVGLWNAIVGGGDLVLRALR